MDYLITSVHFIYNNLNQTDIHTLLFINYLFFISIQIYILMNISKWDVISVVYTWSKTKQHPSGPITFIDCWFGFFFVGNSTVNRNLIGTGYMSADQKKKLLWGNKKNTTAVEEVYARCIATSLYIFVSIYRKTLIFVQWLLLI